MVMKIICTAPTFCLGILITLCLGSCINPVDADLDKFTGSKLLILQAYGTGDKTGGAISHSFIELYNNTPAEIDLSVYSLQYSEGDASWDKLNLTGTIPAHTSFLIRAAGNNADPRLPLDTDYADQEWSQTISNKRFKICLLQSTSTLTVANPFKEGPDGGPVEGYIDMIGSGNYVKPGDEDSTDADFIDVFETSGPLIPCPQLISKNKAMRRISLKDTDNNLTDFMFLDYREKKVPEDKRMNDNELAVYRPKNTQYGAWDPITGKHTR
jgi:hypothetical protein